VTSASSSACLAEVTEVLKAHGYWPPDDQVASDRALARTLTALSDLARAFESAE
jgi:hypothetical protein